MTPQKRKRQGKECNAAAYNFNKSRKVRQIKSNKSKSFPIKSRNPRIIKPANEKKPDLVLYECPFCTKMKPQNKAQNVRQHFLSQHNLAIHDMPALKQIVDAGFS